MDGGEKQYLIFLKYTREYLAQVTGYSRGTLSRVASGAREPTEVFIGVCCHKLKEAPQELFQLVEPQKAGVPARTLTQALVETIDELGARLSKAEARIEALEDELKQ